MHRTVTGLVIAELKSTLGEPGPFIMLGDMDGGPDRIYEVSLLNETRSPTVHHA